MIISVLIGLSSCMDPYYVTKKTTFDKIIDSVKMQMSKDGYKLIGINTEAKNDVFVEATSYSRYSGYGTKLGNNFVAQDTYRFVDTLGNTLNYSVVYSPKQNSDGSLYVKNVSVCGCETSNPNDYEKLCGNEFLVELINGMPRDQEVEKVNVMNTVLAVTGGALLLLPIIVWTVAHTK